MRYLIFTIFILSLTSCVETVLVGSVATGVLITREKTFNDTRKDVEIVSKVINKFAINGLKKPGNTIDVTVNEGRVLLTGVLSNHKIAKKAVKVTWKIKGVEEVIDEIQIVNKKSKLKSFGQYFKDSVITGQIESRILITKNISSVNFKVITVNGTVYLLGLAEDARKIRKITGLVARIKGVRKVISHIIVIDDDRREV